jgi:hypothetical protein
LTISNRLSLRPPFSLTDRVIRGFNHWTFNFENPWALRKEQDMRGAKILGARSLQVCDWPDPAPQGNEVVVKIKAAAICGSDLHGMDPGRLITHRFGLEDAPEAYALFDKGSTGKVIFVSDP